MMIFFSEALDGKIEAVEYILNTILERDDVKVKSAKSQVGPMSRFSTS